MDFWMIFIFHTYLLKFLQQMDMSPIIEKY